MGDLEVHLHMSELAAVALQILASAVDGSGLVGLEPGDAAIGTVAIPWPAVLHRSAWAVSHECTDCQTFGTS